MNARERKEIAKRNKKISTEKARGECRERKLALNWFQVDLRLHCLALIFCLKQMPSIFLLEILKMLFYQEFQRRIVDTRSEITACIAKDFSPQYFYRNLIEYK